MSIFLSATISVMLATPTSAHTAWRRSYQDTSGFVWRDHAYLVAELPALDFKMELDLLLAEHFGKRPKGDADWINVETAERLDAEEILTKAGVVGVARERVLSQFAEARKAVLAGEPERQGYERESGWRLVTLETAKPDGHAEPVDLSPYESMTTHLPGEFLLYLRGAAAYRQKKYRESIRLWEMLLKYPPNARQYRSTWAAFMIGKAYMHLDTARAIPWFEESRRLVASGNHDTLGLSTHSLGWQALAETLTSDYASAIRHYSEQYWTGNRDERELAFQSFRYAFHGLFKSDKISDAVLDDPLVREVITLAALSARIPGPDNETWIHRWAANIETRRPNVARQFPGRIAALYFIGKNREMASYWCGKAPEDDFYGEWVTRKLQMSNYYLPLPVQELERLLERFRWLRESNDAWALRYPHFEYAILNELATCHYRSSDYVPALRRYHEAGNVDDSAYIAEAVLTSSELEHALASLSKPVVLPPYPSNSESNFNQEEFLRAILARKLAREGRYRDAAKHAMADQYNALAETLEQGRNRASGRRARADQLYRAGLIVRYQGLHLLATHFAPDWGRYGARRSPAGRDRVQSGSAGPVEAMRIATNRPTPNRQRHYRWVAADLMWECAGLLPDNDPQLARALWYGGTFIAHVDPEGADKFYKALVKRCGRIPIGRAADELRWFPPKPEDWEDEAAPLLATPRR